ncbi:MAG: GMC family oxidoreductase [Thermodesulfobacteriota bacterium]
MTVHTASSLESDTNISADAVIVGSGAGGATAAYLLARAGKEVVVLEEGGYHQTEDFEGPIGDLMGKLYRDAGMTPILGKPAIAFAEGCCVGGSTVINGGLCWRTPQHVLNTWRGAGLSGLDEASLTPIFEELERDLSISVQDISDSNAASRLLIEGCQQLGWAWERVPRAQIDCSNSNRCPTGCPTGAKQSMLVTYIPKALSKGARIYSDARVTEIVRSGPRAEGVTARVTNGSKTFRLNVKARAVFLAGGSIQTPYLLLRNGFTHQVGTNLQIHFNLKAVATFPQAIEPQRGTMMTAQVKQFTGDDMYIGSSNFDPVYLALTLAPHGHSVVERVTENWRKASIYLVQVKCAGTGKVINARLGRPMTYYKLLAEDVRRIHLGLRRLVQLLLAAGAEEVFLSIAGSSPIRCEADLDKLMSDAPDPRRLDILSVHAMASCPLGMDARTSAADAFGLLHGTDNIFIADAGMLPGATGTNPQITIMAMVYRNIMSILADRNYKL